LFDELIASNTLGTHKLDEPVPPMIDVTPWHLQIQFFEK
jgi:hypothetical protein